ncbi:MAG: DNA-3-methyladenine glycosylase 1 [Acidimicrobiales bacterium]|nr:DNA-3-methyladenine glycosylase 1 [Acidimicrobiales bacterium]
MTGSADPVRCGWAGTDAEMRDYHDTVWGVPQRDNRTLFEFLTLEGAQAGLSWRTILLRKDGYRDVFDGFDIEKIAGYTDADVGRCLGDARIIRNRAKVESTIGNARLWLEMDDPVEYLWSFVDGAPIDYRRDASNPVPASNEISDRMSKQMKKLGFRFVGTTICYAYMQACGLVNDHGLDCFRHDECLGLG